MRLYIYIIIAFLLYFIKDQLGPSNKYSILGKGDKKESVQTLLSRIEWTNTNKTPLLARNVLLCVLLAIFSKAGTGLTLFMLFFILISGFDTYFTHHSTKFANAFVKENIGYIRKKMKLRRTINLKPNVIDDKFKYLNFHYA
jgi:hypothetical protein